MKKFSLKALRVNAELSQKEAAEKLEVSNATLCSWEQGKTFPSQEKIELICKIYDVTYDLIDFRTSSR